MRAMYHRGDIILAIKCDEINTLRYEMGEAVQRAAQTAINHKSLSKAYKDPKQKRLHKNAHARAVTRHKQLKKLSEDLEEAVKGAFK